MPSLKKTVRGIFRQLSFNGQGSSTTTFPTTDPVNDQSARPTLHGSLNRPRPNGGDYHPPSQEEDQPLPNGHHHHHPKKGEEAKNHRGKGFVSTTLQGYRRFSARQNSMAMDANFIHMYLTGRLKKRTHPEIYYGKTGVDLPVLQIVPLDPYVLAAQTGPLGGLTRVPCVNRRPIVKIANLDDELNLSLESDIDLLSSSTCSSTSRSSSSSSIGTLRRRGSYETDRRTNDRQPSLNPNAITDWDSAHDRAYGLSASLYERHPFTKLRAGDPVADVFAICARANSCVLALADGVNWGEKSRLAARCAIRGAVDYLNEALYDSEVATVGNTSDVFRCLLRAFHAGHQLILQEGGSLTTLCVVVVCQLRDSPNWVLCSCNVGDSLAFVYSERHGVREVTLGSHDIQQMRDMRDAGGALGPVDGVNPELHNFTCSMTLVEKEDFVFLTSDGVSDNFDPVVGKFCIIQDEKLIDPRNGHYNSNRATKENGVQTTTASESSSLPKSGLTCLKSPISARRADAAGRKLNSLRVKSESSRLPVVEAYQRHELMLLRMEYLLRRRAAGGSFSKTSRDLCENMLNFIMELTMSKRALLEDPDLYRCDPKKEKEEKLRRRLIRQRVAAMPGKLDHATLVAYRVGEEKSSWADGRCSSVGDGKGRPLDTCLSRIQQAIAIADKSETSTLKEELSNRAASSVMMDGEDDASTQSVDQSSVNSIAAARSIICETIVAAFPIEEATPPISPVETGNRESAGDDSIQITPFTPTEEPVSEASEELVLDTSKDSIPETGSLACDSLGDIEEDLNERALLDEDVDPRRERPDEEGANVRTKEETEAASLTAASDKTDGGAAAGRTDSEVQAVQPLPMDSTDGTDPEVPARQPCNQPTEPEVLAAETIVESSPMALPSLPFKLLGRPVDGGASLASPEPTLSDENPESHRTIASDCFSDANERPTSVRVPDCTADSTEPIRSIRSPDLRARRMMLNESYYIATSPVGDRLPAESTLPKAPPAPLNPQPPAAASCERAPSGGRFGKLSKALDRIERAVKRKHRRGSPNRHTVAVDPTQMTEAKYGTVPRRSHRNGSYANGSFHGEEPRTPATKLAAASSSSPRPEGNPRFRWSPMKVFRTWTMRSVGGSHQQADADRRPRGSQTARGSGQDMSMGVSRLAYHHRSSLSDAVSFPHSASDTHIVQLELGR